MGDKKINNAKTSCAFTGHRPPRFSFGYDEKDGKYFKIQRRLLEWIICLIEKGVNTFYTGMALGVDQWAAAAVLKIKEDNPSIRLIAVIPHAGQADKWPKLQRERYLNILSVCDRVKTISAYYTPSCMYERNRYLVDHSDYLFAVYDGGYGGGTAYTVNYGKKKKRELIIIDPDTLVIMSPVGIETPPAYEQIKLT